jgi:hypothetical protein
MSDVYPVSGHESVPPFAELRVHLPTTGLRMNENRGGPGAFSAPVIWCEKPDRVRLEFEIRNVPSILHDVVSNSVVPKRNGSGNSALTSDAQIKYVYGDYIHSRMICAAFHHPLGCAV